MNLRLRAGKAMYTQPVESWVNSTVYVVVLIC